MAATNPMPSTDRVRPTLKTEALNAPIVSSLVDSPEDVTKSKLQQQKDLFDRHMKSEPVRHDHVHVLTLSWEEKHDDLGVGPEVEDNGSRLFTLGC
jgi:hypothetical protein